MAPSRCHPFGPSVANGRFYRPASCRPSIKARRPSFSSQRRTVSSLSCLTSFLFPLFAPTDPLRTGFRQPDALPLFILPQMPRHPTLRPFWPASAARRSGRPGTWIIEPSAVLHGFVSTPTNVMTTDHATELSSSAHQHPEGGVGRRSGAT